MIIKQFEYKPLAHYSYAVISDGKVINFNVYEQQRAVSE